ncbi:hypothetical protein I4U23_000346 [Adineta vaga]|nr:hypothetical protein I4U23_000346 [Adineta vaga]
MIQLEFEMSIAGIIADSTFFVSAMARIVCSIFFEFLRYITARWLTGLIAFKIREKLSFDEELVLFKNLPDDDDDDTAEIVG